MRGLIEWVQRIWPALANAFRTKDLQEYRGLPLPLDSKKSKAK